MEFLKTLFSGKAEGPGPGLVVDGEGVHRLDDDETVESVAWDELASIAIATTDEGPWCEDFYWMFEKRGGGGCAVAGGLAQQFGLLDALQQRFGDALDNEAIIRASCCTENAWFPCYPMSEAQAA